MIELKGVVKSILKNSFLLIELKENPQVNIDPNLLVDEPIVVLCEVPDVYLVEKEARREDEKVK